MMHKNDDDLGLLGARTQSMAMLGTAIGFVLLFGIAANAYPGGTHFDHASIGHDLWRNTLCDVARTVAIDGAPNAVGCAFARAAMIDLALGLGVLFSALPRLFPSRVRLGTWVRALGAATVPCAIAVVLLPTDRFSELHGLAIMLAGAIGLGAAILALQGLLADSNAPRFILVLSAVTLTVCAVDFGLYARELVTASPAQDAVAVLERVSTILVLAWMLGVARAISVPKKPTKAESTTLAHD
jgi:hypothetical protein